MDKSERREIEKALRQVLGSQGRGQEFNAYSLANQRPPRANFESWERVVPVSHQRTLMGDWVVPVLASLTTGALVGVAASFAGMTGTAPKLIGVATAIVWWVKSNWDSAPFVWITEQMVGSDLDGDGHVGQPQVVVVPQQAQHDPPVILRSAPSTRLVREQQPALPLTTVDVTPPNRRLARNLFEFLVLGDKVGYGVRDLKGQTLTSGTEITDTLWREYTGYLKQADVLESDPSGTRLTVPLDDALKAVRG